MTILLHSPAFSPPVPRAMPRITPVPVARSVPVAGSVREAGSVRVAEPARVAGEARGPSTAAAGETSGAILPVTTAREAIRIARDRTRRMTLLGSVPVLRQLALPWLLPLHLLIVGLTADHIRHTPDASLSYSDGTAPRGHPGSVIIALLLATGWLALLWATLLVLLTWDQTTPAATMVAIALVAPIVELLSLLDFAVRNPEWVTLKRARNRHTGRRKALILTSLVSTRDGCGSAGRLMDLTYPQWESIDAVVIGYPASKSLISYYVRMGARRYGPHTADPTGTSRPTGRSVTFDCRRPLRVR